MTHFELKAIRLALGLSQEKFCDEIGAGVVRYVDIEKGRKPIPLMMRLAILGYLTSRNE